MSLPLILLSCVVAYVWFKSTYIKHPPLPPGPPADPLIGHVRLIHGENQEDLFYEWGKIYGDVIHLRFLRQSVIVLNSRKAAVELLEKRSSNYSDRPSFVIYELMGWVRTLALLRYGKVFQRHRRMMQQYLNANKCLSYQPAQAREARVLLQHLLKAPAERDAHLSRFSTAVIMELTYGHRVKSDDDPYLKYTKEVNKVMHNSGSPGSTPVDLVPFLKYMPSWFPGTYYATLARSSRKVIDDLHNIPFQSVQEQVATSRANPSFVTYHLEARNLAGPETHVSSLEDIKGAAGALYGAGAETTWTTLSTFLFAMLLYPECQVQAQKELDAVIGLERLPEFSDRNSLPYVECILQETLRWHGVLPQGVPHFSSGDDVYRGMFIPKGSLMITNLRGMALDESVYADARSFKPSRYLPQPGGNNEPYFSESFGFGRRICPGRHLADANIWIAIASILATFVVSPMLAEDGKDIITVDDVPFASGLTSKPPPYQCRIQPRSERARSLIMNADISSSGDNL